MYACCHFCGTTEYPDEKTARKLKLVAKVIMTLANFTRLMSTTLCLFFIGQFLLDSVLRKITCSS